MDEHRSAQSTLQRALARGTLEGVAKAAVAVDPAEVEQALAHVASCEECSRCFDLAQDAAWLESREETAPMAHVPVDPPALFESALTAALSDPDDLVRRRAAERLGGMTGLGAVAVVALVAAAGEDRDERVRAAALTALQRLDPKLSLPQWVILVWSAAPAEAASYLEGVLARLATPAGAPSAVTRLGGAETQNDKTVVFSGDCGVRGRVSRESDGLWLTVQGLPAAIENTKPVVAVPSALQVNETTMVWAGDKPGLIAASTPVSKGTLRVRLGEDEEGAAQEATAAQSAAPCTLFDQIYLIHPKGHRKEI
jgi:hypothetical protein